jgi:hypothetical protein
MSEAVITPNEETLPQVEGSVDPVVEQQLATTEVSVVSDKPAVLESVKPTEAKPVDTKPDVDIMKQFRELTDDFNTEPEKPVEKSVEIAKPVLGTPVDARDFTGIEEQHIPLFKKMGNDAFALAKETYLERKTLREQVKQLESKSIPQSYFNNPQAYILTPEFREAASSERTARSIADHWRQQLIAVENGKKWQGLAYDDKGQVVTTEPQTPSAEAKAQILEALTVTSAQANEFTNKAKLIKETFTSRYQEQAGAVKQIEDKYFPGFDKDDHPAKKIVEKISADLANFKDHPVTSFAAKAAAGIILLLEQQKRLTEENTKLKNNSSDSAKAPPTMRAIGSGNATGAAKTVTYADFQKVIDAAD